MLSWLDSKTHECREFDGWLQRLSSWPQHQLLLHQHDALFGWSIPVFFLVSSSKSVPSFDLVPASALWHVVVRTFVLRAIHEMEVRHDVIRKVRAMGNPDMCAMVNGKCKRPFGYIGHRDDTCLDISPMCGMSSYRT